MMYWPNAYVGVICVTRVEADTGLRSEVEGG
jgi:hypothetical protein